MVKKTNNKAASRTSARAKPAAKRRAASAGNNTARKAQATAKAAPVRAAAQINRSADAARTIIKETIDMTRNDNLMPTMDVGAATERMKAMFDQRTMVERTTRVAQETAELAKGNVEAIVESTRIAAKNANVIGQDVAEIGRKGFESASEAIKGFADAKSPVELIKLQGDFARGAMESMIADGARMSETMVKLMGEAMAPVSNRFAVTAERAKAFAEAA